MSAFAAYRIFTRAASPFLPLYLRRRLARGKEDAARLQERLGHASAARPEGALLWLHAASVGEANSVLPLIAALQQARPALRLLLTTGTVTSARLMGKRLPEGVIHQFAPLDTPQIARRFLAHWRPDIALWVESELWPNLLTQARARGCRMALVNARMSARSARGWRRFPGLIRRMIACFDALYAQSAEDAQRFCGLGAEAVTYVGNLKYDGAPLMADAAALAELRAQIGGRPVWLAASVHPGEAAAVARVHEAVRARFPDLLTLIVPRHPAAAENMRKFPWRAAQRSRGEAIGPEVDVYLADTMGELGLFYAVSKIAFLGGSLIPHGGQNPLEAARLGCAALFGRHMHNFRSIAAELIAAGAAREAEDAADLSAAVLHLLSHPQEAEEMGARGAAWVAAQGGVSARLLERLLPMIDEASHAA